ncbi:PepSY domain-containing protein [Streptomyces sp. NPDC003023]|uniref:PepSY domain-containing protein n=1 Tax=Streptomyces sp. NPDC003023 TaxID=3364675 RepID=UPI0036865429
MMKRNLVIATVAAAVLVGGGTYTAAALSSDDTSPARVSAPLARDDDRDDRDDRQDRADAAPSGPITAAQAVTAALKHTPGTVESVDLDDDGADHWEVDVIGKGGDREHELEVDAKTGAVREDADDDRNDDRNDDDRDDDDRAALRAASVDAREAAETALKAHPGTTVTSVDLDDDGAGWEVELRDGKGAERELTVDAKSAAVADERADD